MNPADKLKKEDREWLMEQPQFRRHLFDCLEASAIFSVTREEQQALFLEGKRSLGLEILGWFSAEAEPFDVITSANAARITFSKGAKHDDRDPATE